MEQGIEINAIAGKFLVAMIGVKSGDQDSRRFERG
jgi:hypothetical protein